MCRILKIITFLESLRQAGWFDLFESDIQALLIFDPLITLWGNFDAPYLKLLNDARVASACFYVRTCRRVRNSKKIATIRDFHLPGSFLCLSTRLKWRVMKISYLTAILKPYKNFIFFPWNMVSISVYTHGVKIFKKFRWEKGFLREPPPVCTNGRSGYLMQFSVKRSQLGAFCP